MVSYIYDAWGNSTTRYHQGGSATAAIYNSLRYRGYYYDRDLKMYYLQSRYYDPVVGRFISPDDPNVIFATPMGFTDKNLYAYCDNNPVARVDSTGYAWETFWDAISLGVSVVEVVANPYDPWAWIGLAGDMTDLLIPFLGGIGETTRALKAASQAADVLDDASDLKKGWKLGEDITNLTKAGNIPSWSTIRSRYWKNKAFYFKADYSDNNLGRMKRGLAPRFDDGNGLYPKELHHMLGRKGNGFFLFFEVTPFEHAKIDPYRFIKKRGIV